MAPWLHVAEQGASVASQNRVAGSTKSATLASDNGLTYGRWIEMISAGVEGRVDGGV